MRPTIDSVYVIGKGKYLFVVAVVVLHRHFYRKIVTDQLEIKRLIVKRTLIFIQMLYKFGDPPFIKKLMRFVALFALVSDKDTDAFI